MCYDRKNESDTPSLSPSAGKQWTRIYSSRRSSSVFWNGPRMFLLTPWVTTWLKAVCTNLSKLEIDWRCCLKFLFHPFPWSIYRFGIYIWSQNIPRFWQCAKATHPILARQLCSIFDSEGIQLDAQHPEGDDPSQSYLKLFRNMGWIVVFCCFINWKKLTVAIELLFTGSFFYGYWLLGLFNQHIWDHLNGLGPVLSTSSHRTGSWCKKAHVSM